ncbi:MAG: 3'-5' exonuclease [Geobacteraceae bacterium]|nr:3'-5' exonuclease [Geobacteraceae bacterium]
MAVADMWKKLFKNVSQNKQGVIDDPLFDFVHSCCAVMTSRDILKKNIDSASFCIIDLETTGLDVEHDVIINAAAVKVKKGGITKIYESYVKPPHPIPVESIKWHGITDDMLVDKPSICEVLPELLDFIGDSIIVGHHINFDLRMLKRHVKECYDASLEGAPWLDTMLLHKLVMQNNTSTQLDDLMNIYIVDIQQRHRALGDSIATTRVFLKIQLEGAIQEGTR